MEQFQKELEILNKWIPKGNHPIAHKFRDLVNEHKNIVITAFDYEDKFFTFLYVLHESGITNISLSDSDKLINYCEGLSEILTSIPYYLFRFDDLITQVNDDRYLIAKILGYTVDIQKHSLRVDLYKYSDDDLSINRDVLKELYTELESFAKINRNLITKAHKLVFFF